MALRLSQHIRLLGTGSGGRICRRSDPSDRHCQTGHFPPFRGNILCRAEPEGGEAYHTRRPTGKGATAVKRFLCAEGTVCSASTGCLHISEADCSLQDSLMPNVICASSYISTPASVFHMCGEGRREFTGHLYQIPLEK